MYPLSKSTENFRKALEIANRTAAELGTTFVGSEHFIYAFLCLPDCEAYKILAHEGVCKEEYGALFTKSVDKNPRFFCTNFMICAKNIIRQVT
jgi:ATP-dependent Clp protease ATP-binding subunit ClpA